MTGGYLKGIARNILLALSSCLEWCNISSFSNSNLNTSPPSLRCQHRQAAKQTGLSSCVLMLENDCITGTTISLGQKSQLWKLLMSLERLPLNSLIIGSHYFSSSYWWFFFFCLYVLFTCWLIWQWNFAFKFIIYWLILVLPIYLRLRIAWLNIFDFWVVYFIYLIYPM